MDTNWFDIVTLGLIFLFGLRGLSNGIIKEIFGILGLIGGLMAAVKFKVEAGAWISANVYDLSKGSSISGGGTEMLAGFLAVLFGTWIVCLILGEILSKLMSLSGLGIIDRIGGVIFSTAKIFLIFAVVASMIKTSAFLNTQTKPLVEKSVVYPYLLAFGDKILQIKDIPQIKDAVAKELKNFDFDDINSSSNSAIMTTIESNTTSDNNQTRGDL